MLSRSVALFSCRYFGGKIFLQVFLPAEKIRAVGIVAKLLLSLQRSKLHAVFQRAGIPRISNVVDGLHVREIDSSLICLENVEKEAHFVDKAERRPYPYFS